ncbi:MAG: NAD(+)/NADH kinase [candidate division Zixibacteria bacterium]|nr:NAD(+)/NADH kinase [candidate division Zixibacteria bacterium]
MKLGLLANPTRPGAGGLIAEILDWAKKAGVDVFIFSDGPPPASGGTAVSEEELAARADVVLALGGDGTILRTARAVGPSQKPILGINTGGLGFLAELSNENVAAALEALQKGDFRVEERMVLQAEIKTAGRKFFALNDVVVEKGEVRRLLRLSLSANGEYICSYASDGLIIATPTGSTAYSLSVGGPIINPKMALTIVAPISPHSLASRPLIFEPGDVLEVVLSQPEKEAFLTMDGQVSVKITSADRLEVKRAPHTVRLVRFKGESFYQVLRRKLHWGVLPGEK